MLGVDPCSGLGCARTRIQGVKSGGQRVEDLRSRIVDTESPNSSETESRRLDTLNCPGKSSVTPTSQPPEITTFGNIPEPGSSSNPFCTDLNMPGWISELRSSSNPALTPTKTKLSWPFPDAAAGTPQGGLAIQKSLSPASDRKGAIFGDEGLGRWDLNSG